MIYSEYLSTAEMHRWILDTDIDWDHIDADLALSQTELLDRVRDSALIESFFPLFTPRALEVLWDDVAATAVFSIQLYESYKHFHVFNQYLAGLATGRWRMKRLSKSAAAIKICAITTVRNCSPAT